MNTVLWSNLGCGTTNLFATFSARLYFIVGSSKTFEMLTEGKFSTTIQLAFSNVISILLINCQMVHLRILDCLFKTVNF